MQPFLAASSFCWNRMSDFMTAGGACVGTAITIDFGKQIEIVCLPGRGVYRNCKQGRSRPLLCLFCSSICRGKLSSQNPSGIAYFLTAGNTA